MDLDETKKNKLDAYGSEAMPEGAGRSRVSKHRRIFEYLLDSIHSGQWKPGDRLPSEAELGKFFDASRITVAKAVLDLQRMGLVARRPGAGTHVLGQERSKWRTFGLLIPELGLTEIFEPICHGMMRAAQDPSDALLWGHASSSVQESVHEADQMLRSFITQKVAGVFFAPVELSRDKDAVNGRIVSLLESAKIPIVLLDRCFMPYPERSRHDLVGTDNHRAGFVATSHLLKMGIRRVTFMGEVNSASTVDLRISGFYLAMRAFGVKPDCEPTWRGDPQDSAFVCKMLDSARPEAVVCANDITAARLMQTLMGLDVRIPDEVRIVGMDDVKYASLLPVPLTTIHQNCPEIGAVAMATMIERLKNPGLPTRDVLVPFRLVVRRSCGTPAASTPTSE